MNITDIADRIVVRAAELKKEPLELAREFERAFLEDMKALNITNVERYEPASGYIPQILGQIKTLVDKGAAYETETGVYFEVKKFPKFGQLSGLKQEELTLRRLELCSSKKNPEDFSVWRKLDSGLRWDSQWGLGRPGWHIEDTAISMTNLGDTYDLHGGASELIFPHHEAEIAQAETLSGKAPFVRFWLHTGLLTVKGRKMSKSLGNVIRIRDALNRYTAPQLRFYFASFHYRASVGISERALVNACKQLDLLHRNLNRFHNIQPMMHSGKTAKVRSLLRNAKAKFRNYMNDDFDSPNALEVLLNLSKSLSRLAKSNLTIDLKSKEEAESAFRRMANVFGILS
jgi:cysteinyl-tRNA synthetase